MAGIMPRGPRLDAPGVIHHVMARGIERRQPFRDDVDREDFVARLDALCVEGEAALYAWCLLPNHGISPRSVTRGLERAQQLANLGPELADLLR
jgi:hypothetical protein